MVDIIVLVDSSSQPTINIYNNNNLKVTLIFESTNKFTGKGKLLSLKYPNTLIALDVEVSEVFNNITTQKLYILDLSKLFKYLKTTNIKIKITDDGEYSFLRKLPDIVSNKVAALSNLLSETMDCKIPNDVWNFEKVELIDANANNILCKYSNIVNSDEFTYMLFNINDVKEMNGMNEANKMSEVKLIQGDCNLYIADLQVYDNKNKLFDIDDKSYLYYLYYDKQIIAIDNTNFVYYNMEGKVIKTVKFAHEISSIFFNNNIINIIANNTLYYYLLADEKIINSNINADKNVIYSDDIVMLIDNKSYIEITYLDKLEKFELCVMKHDIVCSSYQYKCESIKNAEVYPKVLGNMVNEYDS